MHSYLKLARTSSHIVSFVNPDHPEAEEVDEEIMHTLAHLNKIFPEWVICTCRFMHHGFFYVSDNCSDLLGLDAEVLINTLQIENYFKLIHPADWEDFTKCIDVIGEVVQREDPADHNKLRFVFNYRIRHSSGRYLYVHDEKANLVLRNGQSLYYLLMKDISHEATFTGVKLAIYKDHKRIREFHPSAEPALQLSKRENELIPLMRQGLSTKEIAARLGISPHTVRNMRQKLFEKFQVNNAIELLNKVDAATEAIIANVKGWELASAV
jgi:DNA-binding CsgD family transcriptional regulator